MIYLICGIAFVLISIISTIFLICDFSFSILLFIVIILRIGVPFIVKGIKKIAIDKKIDKKGKICYGYVTRISDDGVRVKNRQERRATVLVYLESERNVEVVDAVIGINKPEVFLYTCAKLKYYEENFSFLETIPLVNLPIDAKNNIENKIKLLNESFVKYD